MTTVNVDSANTTSIEYDSYGSSPWTLTQTANNGAIFGQTLTRVQGTGGAVFRFHGTSVQVYGSVAVPTVSGATVVSLYALDGGNSTTFSTYSVPDSRVNEVDGQLFFDSGTLSDESHVLVINVTTASEGAPYLLDYIRVVATNPPASTTTTSSTGTPTALPSAGSSKSNVAPIVGGVVGGVVGLLLLVVTGFFYWRRRKHRVRLERGGKDLVEDLVDEPKPDTDSSAPFTGRDSIWRSTSPFHPSPNAPNAESTLAPSDSASQVAGRLYAAELAAQRLAAGQPTGPGFPAAAQANPVASHSRSSPAPTPGSRFNLPPGSGAWRSDRKEAREAAVPPPVPEVPEEEAVQHQDSGIRFRDGELLPPASALALAQAQAHAGGVTSPHGGEDELGRPPEYEDARS
ncbi:hypothetical protein GSI_01031 [Ganoderma sinense ZZ0214-1]|uniref:Uncharacterized protein n=1 Tax=Ganoderma sinense ZZ0214-1 TaxID=1077348 RepID=A0A2G8SUU0_9APHY|nr:hypothetical protein GSI_01031 [Ganoderma sinense ZZ0214-1]